MRTFEWIICPRCKGSGLATWFEMFQYSRVYCIACQSTGKFLTKEIHDQKNIP